MGLSDVTTPPPEARPATAHPDAPPPGTPLGPHFRDCFGCGDRHPSGLHLAVERGPGVSLTARFTVGEAHQGAPGLAHGGLLAAAFDDALGYVLWILHRPAVTGRLETDFRRPVPVGATLHLHARCTGVLGRKIWSAAEGRLDAPDGPLAVRAAALFIGVPADHFTRHGRPAAATDVAGPAAARSYNP